MLPRPFSTSKTIFYVFSFLDDDGVYNKTKEQHLEHLPTLFPILTAKGPALNMEKCVFAIAELDFLGQLISAGRRCRPPPGQVQVILDFPKPTNCKALQRFLGMINFYRRFLPGVARIIQPLTATLAGNPKALPWLPDMGTAFAVTMAALITAVPLGLPLPHLRHQSRSGHPATGGTPIAAPRFLQEIYCPKPR
jgi:hypothetical protein